jgi:hypothetical protein
MILKINHDMRIVYQIMCSVCDSKANVVEESRYNGLRGMCSKCGGNWPES